MALRISYQTRVKNVNMVQGYLYRFKYKRIEYLDRIKDDGENHDPTPLFFMIYRIYGKHPTSGHYWNLIQGCNLNYIPRASRKRFAMNWIKFLQKNNGNVKLTYHQLKKMYPSIVPHAIRRFKLKPDRNLVKVRPISFRHVNQEIDIDWNKDFSKTFQKFRRKPPKRVKKRA